MAIFDWPSALKPSAMQWGIVKTSVQFRSPYGGTVEAIDFPGQYWTVGITLPPRRPEQAGLAEAFFERLAGGTDRVRIGHFLRPVPRGTMRGAPTMAAPVVRGALTLTINATGTLEAGDMFKVSGQLFKTLSLCVPVSGVLTVPLVGRVRNALAAGAAVEWDRPTILCAAPAASHVTSYLPGSMAETSVDLEEVFS